MTRDESLRHRAASVRTGERCGIRRPQPLLLTRPSATRSRMGEGLKIARSYRAGGFWMRMSPSSRVSPGLTMNSLRFCGPDGSRSVVRSTIR